MVVGKLLVVALLASTCIPSDVLGFKFKYHVPAVSIAAVAMIGTHVYTLRNSPKRPAIPQHYFDLAKARFPNAADPTAPLQGQVAIVTGSSSGLGKEIASELYNLGATVVVASRNKDKIQAVADDIRRQVGEGKP